MISTVCCYSQEPIDVTDQTIKIGSHKEEILYFGFAAGDKIIFNFNEAKQKDLKEIEILEYPNNSKFSDYKTKSIENKTIAVQKDGVYMFRFKNTAMNGRICKIHIQRIPASEATRDFNTTVTWENQQKTTYHTYTKDVLIGYDTLYVPKNVKELINTELNEDMIVDRTEKVHSTGNLDYTNKTTIRFSLPKNTYSPEQSKEIVAWAYWIGVGNESEIAWKKNVNTVKNLASGIAAISGAGPLAGIAIGAISELATPSQGEDVMYQLYDSYNKTLTYGKEIATYGKENEQTQGDFFIYLENDNRILGINVHIKICVIWETKYYEYKTITEMKVQPKYETRTFTDPIVHTYQVPVLGQ